MTYVNPLLPSSPPYWRIQQAGSFTRGPNIPQSAGDSPSEMRFQRSAQNVYARNGQHISKHSSRTGNNDRTEPIAKDEHDNMGIILDKPRFPKYSTLYSRIKSYGTCSNEFNLSPELLSEAGFAYTGTGDSVRCYHCGGGLRHWRPDDCPWREHAHHYRHCGHVRQCKGDRFIRFVHGEVDSEYDTDDTISSPSEHFEESYMVSEAIQTNSVAIEAAKEFCPGTDEARLKAAIKHLITVRGKHTFSAMDLVNALEELEESDENHTEDDDALELDGIPKSRDKLEKENVDLKQPLLCKICLEAQACIITLPCGHMCSCPQCISALSKCAVCREPIKGTVRALMSLKH